MKIPVFKAKVVLMKDKIIFVINAVWSAILAFLFPIGLGIIYMDITGHSKGYAYDLGSEKSISIMFGVVELIIWLIFAIPSNVYILKKIVKKNKYLFFLYFILFVILSGVCIFLLGGWDEYIKVFGVYK